MPLDPDDPPPPNVAVLAFMTAATGDAFRAWWALHGAEEFARWLAKEERARCDAAE